MKHGYKRRTHFRLIRNKKYKKENLKLKMEQKDVIMK
jgi:hypothetical protein